MFSFDPKKVKLDETIGEGGYGRVYAYEKNPGDEDWVVKVMEAQQIKMFLQQIQEIVLGFSFDHPNVIPIKGFYIDYDGKDERWNTYIKLPRMKTSMKEKIKTNQLKKEQFSENQIACYFYDLVHGLEYLHERKIAHCDIKPGNILIDKDGKLRIADFGVGEFVGDENSKTLMQVEGTTGYIAPEIFGSASKLKKGALFKADVWSLGLVMLEVSLSQSNFNQDINKFEENLAKAKLKLKGKGYSNVLIDLILDLLQLDPLKRKSLKEIKQILEQNYPHLLKYSGEWKEKIKEIRKKLKKTNGELFSFKEYVYEKEIGITIEPKVSSRLQFNSINDDQIKNMIKGLTENLNECNYLKEFKVLSINLQDCVQITDDAVSELAIKIGSKLNNLKYLSLEVQNCNKITDKGIQALATQFETNLRNLESLLLYFRDSPGLTDMGAQELIYKIASGCKDLKIIGLDFGKCKISDLTINQLTKALPNSFKDLKKLFIYLLYCSNISEKSILGLIDEAAANLKNIEALSFSLAGCKITDDTTNQLSKCIKIDFMKLKSLTLYFDECYHINNEPLKELIYQISSKQLQSLKLGLWNCTQIDQKTIQFICTIIQNELKSLETLQLWFNNLNVDKQMQDNIKNSFAYISDRLIEF